MRRIARLPLLFTAAVLALTTNAPAHAQESLRRISFDGFSFSYPESLGPNLAIRFDPGTAPDAQIPGGPQPKHISFTLYGNPEDPDLIPPGSRAGAVILVMNAGDLIDYPRAQVEQAVLVDLLAMRPDFARFYDMAQNIPLPFLPPQAGDQSIRARARYVDLPTVSGVVYLTNHRFDAAPPLADDLTYTFQGISKDSARLIAGIFRPTANVLPAQLPPDFDYNAFTSRYAEYMGAMVRLLTDARPSDFTPSLDVFDALISTFTVE